MLGRGYPTRVRRSRTRRLPRLAWRSTATIAIAIARLSRNHGHAREILSFRISFARSAGRSSLLCAAQPHLPLVPLHRRLRLNPPFPPIRPHRNAFAGQPPPIARACLDRLVRSVHQAAGFADRHSPRASRSAQPSWQRVLLSRIDLSRSFT